MRTIIILGAGQFGRACANLLNASELRLLAFGDNNTRLHRRMSDSIPVVSVEQAVAMKPHLILLGVTDKERTEQLRSQALDAGFKGEFLFLSQFCQYFDIRSATLCRIAAHISQKQIPGCIAELGVYKGDLACRLNALFPKHTLYLFDTFEGFDFRDIRKEHKMNYSGAREGDFSDTSDAAVLARLPYPFQAVIRKGYFPDTACGLEDIRYALVSLDADLYAPVFSGLQYFYPRLSKGGMILLHDYNNERFRGVKQAVDDYEKEYGDLFLIPLCDLHGSAVILHP